jgi:serine protease
MNWFSKQNRSIIAALVVGLALAATSARAETARVIVKYRSNSAVQAQTSNLARAAIMSAQTGLNVTESRDIGSRMHAMQVPGMTSADLASRLAARSDVEYAVPDEMDHIQSTPNDALLSSQWYLLTSEASAINATGAWNTTTGASSVVVAVVDTGILGGHPDLTDKLYWNGSTPYGYDFISDSVISNDGDTADADPSDPGDWVTSAEASSTSSELYGCTVSNSSWHGTFVAGIIAAATNNTIGGAGVSWGSMIVPVRVLGKCGGYVSDIIAGMRWAAGLTVTGVAANTHPAKIINMSLGGTGTCSAAYQDAINEVTAAGALVVVAAGNDGGAVSHPGNCSNVLTVAALNHTGDKTYYSNNGSEVGIAAPGGNWGPGATCAYCFVSTRNAGTQSPDTTATGYTYSTSADGEMGTSFATPLVAGTAALMLSVNPSLTPAQLITLLKSSATAFPTVSGDASCTATTTNTVCNCTTATCGAGMLNANAAVAHVLIPTVTVTAPSTAAAGSTVSLSGTVTAAYGHTIASYVWTTTGGTLTNPTTLTPTLTMPNASSATVTLTATDEIGSVSSASATITAPSAVTTPESGSGGSGGGGASDLSTLLLMLGLGTLAYASRRR